MGLPQAKPSVREEFPPEASLMAEVERLKRELAVARARIGELEARADVDPLLDILNRRGFERELKRALAHAKRYGTPAALMPRPRRSSRPRIAQCMRERTKDAACRRSTIRAARTEGTA